MRRMAMVALAAALMTGYGATAARAQSKEKGSDAAVDAAARAMVLNQPKVATMNWSQVTGGVLTKAPYPVYPGATLGMAADYGAGLYTVSTMTFDSGAKADAFYRSRMNGWTRRVLKGGSIVYVKGAAVTAEALPDILKGTGVMIEGKGFRPYTLISFFVRTAED